MDLHEAEAIVVKAYRDILGRAPEEAGKKYYAGKLVRGMNYNDLVSSLQNSKEYHDRQHAALHTISLPPSVVTGNQKRNGKRIEICGFYGFGNVGDEAILQSIIDSLGGDNEYIISTSLPYTYQAHRNYHEITGKEIRIIDDPRIDIDAYILGGGGLNWGYGWRQCLSMFSKNVPCMNMAVGYNTIWYYSEKLHKLYHEFLKNFNVISVRDEPSFNLINQISPELNPVLTFDPAINLKEEPWACPVNKIAVFPRHEDDGIGAKNDDQLNWLVQELKPHEEDVVIVACSPTNQGNEVDSKLCNALANQLKGSSIINISPFQPRKFKYFISQCKMVYSGGRYHPVVFAIAHNIPYKFSPTAFSYVKNRGLVEMHNKYGTQGLKQMASTNTDLFKKMMGYG